MILTSAASRLKLRLIPPGPISRVYVALDRPSGLGSSVAVSAYDQLEYAKRERVDQTGEAASISAPGEYNLSRGSPLRGNPHSPSCVNSAPHPPHIEGSLHSYFLM